MYGKICNGDRRYWFIIKVTQLCWYVENSIELYYTMIINRTFHMGGVNY